MEPKLSSLLVLLLPISGRFWPTFSMESNLGEVPIICHRYFHISVPGRQAYRLLYLSLWVNGRHWGFPETMKGVLGLVRRIYIQSNKLMQRRTDCSKEHQHFFKVLFSIEQIILRHLTPFAKVIPLIQRLFPSIGDWIAGVDFTSQFDAQFQSGTSYHTE